MRAAGGSSTSSTSPATPTWIIPPSASAIITRVLESHGYKVGFIAAARLERPGKHRGGSASRGWDFSCRRATWTPWSNHYTVNKKRRHDDAYTPGGQGAARAPTTRPWSIRNLIRRTFKETPIILGGIEASLRRLAHYDYCWIPSSAPSCLIPGPTSSPTAWGALHRRDCRCPRRGPFRERPHLHRRHGVFAPVRWNTWLTTRCCPSSEEVSGDKRAFAESFATQYRASDPVCGSRLVETYPHGVYVVQNPPAAPLTQMRWTPSTACPMRARGILPTTRPAACRRFPR